MTLEELFENARKKANQALDEEVPNDISYSLETLEAAYEFMKLNVQMFEGQTGKRIPLPHIGNGPTGSVDLYWHFEGNDEDVDVRLLINIEPDKIVSVYGSVKEDDISFKARTTTDIYIKRLWLFLLG